MDQLSKFMGGKIAVEELNAFDKIAFGKALGETCMDEGFLTQFEGTPLAPQAVALAEQELAMEQRHLQARMARAAQTRTDNYDQEWNEREGLRLQKMQLAIELHKMKAMGQGAPTPPGQAVIGEPQPSAAELTGAVDPASAGGAPAEVAPPADPAMGGGKLAALINDAARKGWSQTVKPMADFARNVGPKVASMADWVGGPDTTALNPEVASQIRRRNSMMQGGIGALAGGLAGGSIASDLGAGGKGHLLGVLAGAGVGGLGNVAGVHMGSKLRGMIDSGRDATRGRGVIDGRLAPEDNRLMHHLNKLVMGKEVYHDPSASKEASIKAYAQKLRTGT